MNERATAVTVRIGCRSECNFATAAESGSQGIFSPSPHNTPRAAQHGAFPQNGLEHLYEAQPETPKSTNRKKKE